MTHSNNSDVYQTNHVVSELASFYLQKTTKFVLKKGGLKKENTSTPYKKHRQITAIKATPSI